MRQIFASQRVETVEGVARLLNDAGIETRIRNGRSYQGKRGGQFSYHEPLPAAQQPSLWIVHAEDQPRAREILRGAGLLDSTRPDQRKSLLFAEREEEASPRRSLAWRIRLVLLLLIAVAALFVYLHHLRQPPPAPPADDEVRVQIRPTGGR